MPENNQQYLHQQLNTAQNQYTYFLLAAAASAIVLAVKQTETTSLRLSQAPLGVATVCWGLSFFFGCRRIAWYHATLRANFELSKIQSGAHPDVPPHPDYRDAAAEGTRQAAEINASQVNVNAKRQFGWLVAGAVFFVVWHILEMALRTPGLANYLWFLQS